MKTIYSINLLVLGLACNLVSCVNPYPQNYPQNNYPSQPQTYQPQTYRQPYNDSGSTVHCGVDYDHRAHTYHSKQHHEHYCPGGPHDHH